MKTHTLITGASSGIGLELAVVAAREKHNLVLVARDEANLSKLAKKLRSFDIQIEILALDLTLPGAAQKVFEFCKQKNIFVGQLINSAGIGDYSPFVKNDVKKQTAMIELNIRALTEITRLFLPAMVAAKTGRIMNLGSVASFLPGPKMAVYYASKHYVLTFSESLAAELRGSGVSVTCLCPGPTKSNFDATAHASQTNLYKNKNLPTAAEVANYGWYAMQHGQAIAIHGWRNRWLAGASRFIPRRLLAGIVSKVQQ